MRLILINRKAYKRGSIIKWIGMYLVTVLNIPLLAQMWSIYVFSKVCITFCVIREREIYIYTQVFFDISKHFFLFQNPMWSFTYHFAFSKILIEILSRNLQIKNKHLNKYWWHHGKTYQNHIDLNWFVWNIMLCANVIIISANVTHLL